MSESSHMNLKHLNWITRSSLTCFPEAFDRITPEAEVNYVTYTDYHKTMKRWDDCPSSDMNPNRHNATIARLYTAIAEDLGGYALSDMVFEDAKQARRIQRVLDEFFSSDMRPVIDITTRTGDSHTVGVRQVDLGLYRLVGTGVPVPIRNQAVSADELQHFVLDVGTTTGLKRTWPFLGANISALPKPPKDFVVPWN